MNEARKKRTDGESEAVFIWSLRLSACEKTSESITIDQTHQVKQSNLQAGSQRHI